MPITPDPAGQLAAVTTAVQRASRLLLARQDSQGWWSGRPEGDISLDAEGLLVREFLGIRTPELTKAVAQQIRSLQRTDGSWAGCGEPGRTSGADRATDAADPGEPGCASDLSASALAYLGLRLAGDSPDAYHMAVAAGWIRDAGGLAATGQFTRAWLAIFGLTGWDDLPVPHPEIIYLPERRGAALGPWAAWSRPATISLAIIGALRPVRRLPFNLGALRVPGSPGGGPGEGRRQRAYQRGLRVPPLSAARSAALRKCGQWLIGWQQRDVIQAGIRPMWPCALIALQLLGYGLDHPVMAEGLAWLDSVTPRPRSAASQARPAQPRRPPVRDTTLAIQALADSGLPPEHPALLAAGDWLLGQWISGSAGLPAADLAAGQTIGQAAGHAAAWHGPQPDPDPCGWSFGSDGYPNVADTARVLLALGQIRLPGQAGRPAIGGAVHWLAAMQGRDGGWGCSAAVTALAVQALAANGPAGSRAVRRGVVWLLRARRPDGSWQGGPGESDLYATATVLPALLAAGVLPGKPAVSGAAGWLVSRQNPDAGWPSGADHPGGPDGRAGGGRSDAPGTARALTALLAVRAADLAGPADQGADWLVRAQQADGGWPERPAGRSAARNRGNIVPGLLLPLSALGRYVAGGGSWRERARPEGPAGDVRLPPAACGQFAGHLQGPLSNRLDHQ
jgi:squalene-hopene/tetraprenyl-beta-curcumene cyclase